MSSFLNFISNIRGFYRETEAEDKQNVIDSGLVDTGKGLNSIKNTTRWIGGRIISTTRANDYLIEFNRRRSLSEVQLDLNKLTAWVKKKKAGASRSEINRFVGNIINKWREEGMPTIASRKYAPSGKRVGWIDRGTQFEEDNFSAASGLDEYIEESVDEMLKQLF